MLVVNYKGQSREIVDGIGSAIAEDNFHVHIELVAVEMTIELSVEMHEVVPWHHDKRCSTVNVSKVRGCSNLFITKLEAIEVD